MPKNGFGNYCLLDAEYPPQCSHYISQSNAFLVKIPQWVTLALFSHRVKEIGFTMEKNTSKNYFGTLLCGLVLLTAFNAYAQFPAASALLSNNIDHYSINSSDDYMRIEQKINSVAGNIRDAHQKYPNLKYTPSFSNDQLTGFIITGVSDNAVADELSSNLMLLDQLGQAVSNMDISLLPNIKENKLSKVSKKEASR